MWSSILHDVALATESSLTFIATEVLHVPVPAFGLGAFVGKNDLRDRQRHNENQQNIEMLSDGEKQLNGTTSNLDLLIKKSFILRWMNLCCLHLLMHPLYINIPF